MTNRHREICEWKPRRLKTSGRKRASTNKQLLQRSSVPCLQIKPVERWSNTTFEAVNCPNLFQSKSETETCFAVSPEHQP